MPFQTLPLLNKNNVSPVSKRAVLLANSSEINKLADNGKKFTMRGL